MSTSWTILNLISHPKMIRVMKERWEGIGNHVCRESNLSKQPLTFIWSLFTDWTLQTRSLRLQHQSLHPPGREKEKKRDWESIFNCLEMISKLSHRDLQFGTASNWTSPPTRTNTWALTHSHKHERRFQQGLYYTAVTKQYHVLAVFRRRHHFRDVNGD